MLWYGAFYGMNSDERGTTVTKNDFMLDGDVAVITGAGSGIGEGTAHVLAKAGARVVCAGRREEAIERVASAIRDEGGEAIAVRTDVTVDADVERLMQAGVDEWGRLDILINNAGGSPIQAPLVDLPREEWDATLALNMTAVWNCTRFASRLMGDGGRVVNVSSIAADQIVPGTMLVVIARYTAPTAPYQALVADLEMLVQQGHAESVNLVMPKEDFTNFIYACVIVFV